MGVAAGAWEVGGGHGCKVGYLDPGKMACRDGALQIHLHRSHWEDSTECGKAEHVGWPPLLLTLSKLLALSLLFRASHRPLQESSPDLQGLE